MDNMKEVWKDIVGFEGQVAKYKNCCIKDLNINIFRSCLIYLEVILQILKIESVGHIYKRRIICIHFFVMIVGFL